MKSLECPDDLSRAWLAGTYNEHSCGSSTRKQGSVSQPHNWWPVYDNKIEHLQSDRKQRKHPCATKQICRIGRKWTRRHEGKVRHACLLKGLRRRAVPSQVITEANGIVEADLGV